MMKKDEEKRRKEEKDKLKKKEERHCSISKKNSQKDKEQAEKAENLKRMHILCLVKIIEEVYMKDDSVVFTESSTSDHLPKGTLPRLPLT